MKIFNLHIDCLTGWMCANQQYQMAGRWIHYPNFPLRVNVCMMVHPGCILASYSAMKSGSSDQDKADTKDECKYCFSFKQTTPEAQIYISSLSLTVLSRMEIAVVGIVLVAFSELDLFVLA